MATNKYYDRVATIAGKAADLELRLEQGIDRRKVAEAIELTQQLLDVMDDIMIDPPVTDLGETVKVGDSIIRFDNHQKFLAWLESL